MTAVVDPLFAGDGEMATRLKEHDWSATSLGPMDAWSQSLRTAVGIVLRSRYPMLLSWGDDLAMIYNDAFIPTLGTKHPAAMGKHLPEVFAEVWDAVGPMQRSVLAGGESTWFEDLRLDIDRGNGLEETFFTFSYSHVPDSDGPGGVLAVLSVTTAKVVAARRLALLNDLGQIANRTATPDRAMAEALEALERAADDLLAGALYRPGMAADQAPTLLRTGGFAHGVAPLPETVDVADHPVLRAWRTHQPTPDEARPGSVALPVRGQEDVQGVLLLVPHPLRPLDGDFERFLGLVADQVGQILTVATARAHEQARLEALAALDAAKSAFLSNVSHEFRTPLTLLLGPLEDVVNGTQRAIGPDDAAVMAQSAHRLLRMVNGLLDVARIGADGLLVTPALMDLAELTRDLLQPFGSAAQRAGLTLHARLDPEVGQVLVDPQLWEKIVLNLVANAIKFTSVGHVDVSLTQRGDQVVLTVSDTGRGIAEADLGKVFDRFHRVQASAAQYAEGTGLGLTLVAEAAAAMGGSVTVDSRPGAGSTFEVVLPLVREGAEGAPAWAPNPAAAQALADEVAQRNASTPRRLHIDGAGGDGSGDASILVVEDNPAVAERVARLLSTLGETTIAPDGLVALEVLRAGGIDLVVTDVMMPQLDGLGLLRKIRSDPSLRSTPVVILSARAGAEAAAHAIEAGADDYVVKPFTPGELLARCRTNLELADYRARATASQVRNALLAGVSHDMQSPLAVITTALGLLAEPALDATERAHVAERARIRAAQLTRLVTQFLDWSRLSMNQPLPVRAEPIDLVEMLRSIAAEHERVQLDLDPTGAGLGGSLLWLDRQRTEGVVHNLVENAKRVDPSRIEIELTGDSETITIRVRDDGPGISAEVLPRLFDAFSPSTAARGSGLGLHVSREAARAQGGDLVLESTGPEGTLFALRLPRRHSR